MTTKTQHVTYTDGRYAALDALVCWMHVLSVELDELAAAEAKRGR